MTFKKSQRDSVDSLSAGSASLNHRNNQAAHDKSRIQTGLLKSVNSQNQMQVSIRIITSAEPIEQEKVISKGKIALFQNKMNQFKKQILTLNRLNDL